MANRLVMQENLCAGTDRFTPSKASSPEVYQHTPLPQSPFSRREVYQHTPLQESQFPRHDVNQHTPLQETQRLRHDRENVMYQMTPLQEPQRSKKPSRIPLEDITNLMDRRAGLAMGEQREQEEDPGSSEKTSLIWPKVPAEPLALFRSAGNFTSESQSGSISGIGAEACKQHIQYGAARRMRMI
eukprot:gnl/MRDRNA2_/MRDRNA2_132591_c0_seq1.p1 gnl/MRDRNA2_/MRDRNA2_132591_c0~~gnl/MRDRNA2_/MRDRNA2_132591_c0_seq1.p1  ORF type:complete len:185 (+),score=31.84 gnl/MRDRNA2_/MRDRNA2_132591_c0_seq1:61-615(+)